MSALPKFPPFRPFATGALLSLLLLSAGIPAAIAATRISARDRAAADAIAQRMAAAERRHKDALQRIASEDPAGQAADDAALQEMEATLDACLQQRGCEAQPLLATYKRALKDSMAGDDGDDEDEAGEDGADDDMAPEEGANDPNATPLPSLPESERAAFLLNDQRHDFDRRVQFNPAIEAGIRRWLTDMRPQLVDSYENYRNMRAQLYPAWQRDNLPEALLFGILAKESAGKVHAVSRTGAAGPLQFMPATGRRFGLGQDGTGFDTRYDPSSVGYASADYIKERMGELNNSIEFALAAYNGGEGRALRVFQQYPGRSFWDDVVYYQFPAETREYVPMVIAAAWLFVHPKQFGLKFPRVNPTPAPLQLAQASSLNELTICLGNGGTRDGFLRTLRNLNPRYQPDSWIPPGTSLQANTRIVRLYNRYCTKGPHAELARTLVNADVRSAIARTPLPEGTVAVGDVTSLAADPPPRAADPPKKKEKPKPVKRYRVAKGDTLGKIADRHDCSLKELAKANKLRAPGYTVKPGQTIRLEGCGK